MKDLLVTGGCGFIGTNFIRYLFLEADFDGRVINVDKLTYAGNAHNLRDIAQRFAGRYVFIHADICDQVTMEEIFRKYHVDAVCHLAAESHVDRSIHSPQQFLMTNVMGTLSLLEAAKAHMDHLEVFHHVSTDEVFGSLGLQGSFSEQSPYRPNSPYAASKAASDHLVRAYHKTYGLPITISNCSNNFGPYQFPEKLIPLMILNALDGSPLPIYGDGRNVRDWLYVRDHCAAIWEVMKRGKRGEAYNVGADNQLPNLEVVRIICDMLDDMVGRLSSGPRRSLITFVKDRPGHDLRYAIDASKIKEQLGWCPSESFDSAMEKTIRWYLDNPEWVQSVQTGEYRRWIERQYGWRREE